MSKLLNIAKNVLVAEAKAIMQTANYLDDNFVQACMLIKNCTGKIIIMGIGKSGHIGNKIAATLASTGAPSFFVHPAEAGHGDLGMIEGDDIIIFISYSGAANEIINLIPLIKRLGVKTIAITGDKTSVISANSDIWLDASVASEACPHNLAPTNSTTVALALGDALAITVLQDKGFSPDDFARSHPSGALGRRLLTSVADIMQTGHNLPIISTDMPLIKALLIMSEKKLGMLIMVDNNLQLLGIFTDGDLRRVIAENDINNLTIFTVMSNNPKSITSNQLAVSALDTMEKFNINSLPVIKNNKVVGAINMHSLIQAKII